MKNVVLAAFLYVWIWPLSTFAQSNITYTTLVEFGGTNGQYPDACLIQGSDGNFYGTTLEGGTNNLGTVYRMTPDGLLTTLVSFNGANGSFPEAPLFQGNDGNFYGTTQEGGTNGDYGTVFSITSNGAFNSLVSFANTNGANVSAGLVQGTDGNFYGTTFNGGIDPLQYPNTLSHDGTVFKMTPDGALTTVYSFYLNYTYNYYNMYPDAGLVEGKDGNFYGTTEGDAFEYNYGAIFNINTNGVLNALDIFELANESTAGSVPTGPLVLGSDGNFYGMTTSGGTNGWGTVFRMNTNGTLTTLFSFNGTNGAFRYSSPVPSAFSWPMVQGSDGNFYGETVCGGPTFTGPIANGGMNTYGNGTVFQITANGVLTTLYSFGSVANDGANPEGGLIQATDGNFYGVTYNGGSNGYGTIFRLSVPLQPVFQSVVQTNGTLTLVWNSVANQTYQLQYTTDLTSTGWSNLCNSVVATNGVMSLSDSIGPDSQRFYRVVLLQ